MTRERKRELLASLCELASVGASLELSIESSGTLRISLSSRRQRAAINERFDVGHSDADVIGFFARAARRVP